MQEVQDCWENRKHENTEVIPEMEHKETKMIKAW
jgi:hypothetical protein